MWWWSVSDLGKDYGPGAKTVFLTDVSVDKPLQIFNDYDD